MKYRLRDMQFNYRYFGGDEEVLFNTKKEIRETLISYHTADYDENFLAKMSLNELLEFGSWRIEELKKEVKICK